MTDAFSPRAPLTVPIVGVAERFVVGRLYCLARNHADHALEVGAKDLESPSFFLKPADTESTVVVEAGATGKVRYPSLTHQLIHEIELVIAIGTGGKHIAAADAHRHVYGYAVGLDMTRFDLQRDAASKGQSWCPGKSFDDSAVIGPITPANHAGAVEDAEIYLLVNGDERQRSRVSRMIWNVATMIERLSRTWTLRPGDLIFTGTPKGVSAVVPGDHMHGGITGLGTLQVDVVDADTDTTTPARAPITRYLCDDLSKPLPIYNHAAVHRGVAQISAVQGFVPGTFTFPDGDVAAEAEQMMHNLAKILHGIGSDLTRILKMTLYFTDMARDFPAVNEVVNRHVPRDSPARSSIGVAALPRAARVVVDCSVAVD